MAANTDLARKLKRARKSRGWNLHQAAQRANMHHFALKHLEGDSGKPAPSGDEIKVRTMLELTRIYWPDISLEDWTGRRTLFRLVPSDTNAKRSLALGLPRELPIE